MEYNRAQIKHVAKEAAKGNRWRWWKMLIFGSLIASGISVIGNIVSAILAGLGDFGALMGSVIALAVSIVSAAATMIATFTVIKLTLNIYDGKPKEFDPVLFGSLDGTPLPDDTKYDASYWKDVIFINFVMTAGIFLGTILFVIPGIYFMFCYCMSLYVKADHPEYDWKECMKASKEMMIGQKWKYIIFVLSFILWEYAVAFTFGIAGIWVAPYMAIASAGFYRYVSNTAIKPIESNTSQPEV